MNKTSTILIADDNITNRRILTRSLSKAGFVTIEACDGPETLELATSQLPDLILLDVDMPGMDGFQVCQQLKDDSVTQAIPIIFLTSKSDSADAERAFAVGGSDYVTKPFHITEVKARVSVHLRLRRIQQELLSSHTELLRAQKLESVGQLAAGIAHEINTPTQFIGINTRFLKEAFEDLSPMLEQAQELANAVLGDQPAREIAMILKESMDDIDIELTKADIHISLQQSIEGIERVSKIVQAMKEFSHPGSKDMTYIDLNDAIESTITVASNEWKYVAEMITDFDAHLPNVFCLPGELNQVILNMIVNAAHAIEDVVGDGDEEKGTITIATRVVGEAVEVRISDTGTGVPEANRERLFDPFFTTKSVGKGTGQGLSIAYDVVVDQHNGSLTFESECGRGTTFIIMLPLKEAASKEVAA